MHGFRLNHLYSRKEINAKVGGSMLEYLPCVGKKVVAGCFRLDINPDAPDVILPGNGPRIKQTAQFFVEQKTAVPVFIKRRVSAWQYVGDYRVKRRTFKAKEIKKHAQRARRNNVSSVIYLEHVGDGC